MKRTIATILAVLALTAFTASCAKVSTAPSEVAVIQDNGRSQDKVPVDCVPPGTNKDVDLSDLSFSYMTDLRSYDFTDDKAKSETESIQVMTKDNVPINVSGSLIFVLNGYCPVLVAFHKSVGLAAKAFWQSTDYAVEDEQGGESVGDTRGWKAVLDRQLKKQIISAVKAVFRKYNLGEISSAPLPGKQAGIVAAPAEVPDIAKNLEDIQNTASNMIFAGIRADMGGDYFCEQSYIPPAINADAPTKYDAEAVKANPCNAPRLQIIPPDPPESILKSAVQEQTALADLRRAQAEKATRDAELESEQKWIDAIGPCNWTLKYLADKNMLDKAPALVRCSGSNANILVDK